jgi:hypothetical protein
MGKIAEAVKKGGDFWRQELPQAMGDAHIRSLIYADSALFDKLVMRYTSKLTKVNGSGYADSMAGSFSEHIAHCVI